MSEATLAACESLDKQAIKQTFYNHLYFKTNNRFALPKKASPIHKQQMIIDEPSLQKKVKPNDPQQDQLSLLLKWRNEYIPPTKSLNADEFKSIKTTDIASEQLDKHAGDLSALFINITWKIDDSSTGKTIEDLKKLSISDKLMNNGIIFIWSEKIILGKIVDVLDTKGFQYIENFMVTQLSADKALEMQRKNQNQQNKEKKITDFFKRITPQKDVWSSITPEQIIEQEKFPANNYVQDIFVNSDYEYFRKSKKILLMFRKFNKEAQLELRHQRTSDIFFDIFQESKINEVSKKGMEFTYRMIETLLPKANFCEENKGAFKMMELYANEGTQPRKGWISVYEETK